MEDLFVPWELSKKLYKLGFDEPCFKKYIAGCLWNSSTTQTYYRDDIHENGSDCLAPLFQQVFDWFEKKHNIQVFSDYYYYDGFYYRYKWCKTNGEYGEFWKDGEPDGDHTRRESAIYCIEKLIEMVS